MLKGFFKLSLIEFKLFLRAPIATFFTFIFPVFFLFLIMEILIDEPQIKILEEGIEIYSVYVINYVIPPLLILIVGTTSIMGIPSLIVFYRETKFFKRLRATPLSSLAILFSLGASYFFISFLGIFLLILIGKIFYQAQFKGDIFIFSLAFFLSFLSLVSIGFIIASLCRTSKTAFAVSYIVFFPMMFFSGIFFPIKKLPVWLNSLGTFIPTTHTLKLLRGLWFGESPHIFLEEILILLGVMVLGFIISMKAFRWE